MGSSLYWVQRACVGCSEEARSMRFPFFHPPQEPSEYISSLSGCRQAAQGGKSADWKVSVLHHVLPTSANAHVSPDPSSGGPGADEPSATRAQGASGDGALSSTVTITTAGNAHDCLG